MQTRRAPPILRVAAVSGLLVVAGLAVPGTALGQTYGGGPGGIAPVAPPSAQPPGVPPSNITAEVAGRPVTGAPPSTAPAAVVSAAPPSTAPAAAPAAAGPAAPAPGGAGAPPSISEVAGGRMAGLGLVEQPAAVAQPAPVAEVAPRSVAAPPSEQVLARAPARQDPGLEAARVLPKAGEGLGNEAGIWPPLVMALAAVAIGVLGLLWPRLRRRTTHST
jgi:hypothetical protein